MEVRILPGQAYSANSSNSPALPPGNWEFGARTARRRRHPNLRTDKVSTENLISCELDRFWQKAYQLLRRGPGQKEMLMPIVGKKPVEEAATKKPSAKPHRKSASQTIFRCEPDRHQTVRPLLVKVRARRDPDIHPGGLRLRVVGSSRSSSLSEKVRSSLFFNRSCASI